LSGPRIPEIEDYRFGKVRVSGKEYRKDVIILPDGKVRSWWRKEGHRLCLEDLEDVIQHSPEVIVIGTGAYGIMRVPEEVIKELSKRGIRIVVKKTRDACDHFNELIKTEKRVAAALHLTC